MIFDTRPKVTVALTQTGERYPCAHDESLLAGMLKLGRKGIPVGCASGGCGVCKVRVVEGAIHALGPVSRAHVSADEECQGVTLACRVAPSTPVVLEVVGKFEKPFFKGYAAAVAAGPSLNQPQ